MGFHYGINDKRLTGNPGIVLPQCRAVVFVYDRVWHGHFGGKYFKLPVTSRDFWAQKNDHNRIRDINCWYELEVQG